MRILMDVVMIGFALAASVCDWKKRTIPVNLLVAYTAAVLIGVLFHIKIGGFLIGIFFFIVSKITKEAIGYGDSWMITIIGMYLGGKELIRLLFTASFLACLVSLLFMWKQGWKREGSLPFVPFLTAGLLEVIFL